jgi:hypothetical protein
VPNESNLLERRRDVRIHALWKRRTRGGFLLSGSGGRRRLRGDGGPPQPTVASAAISAAQRAARTTIDILDWRSWIVDWL